MEGRENIQILPLISLLLLHVDGIHGTFHMRTDVGESATKGVQQQNSTNTKYDSLTSNCMFSSFCLCKNPKERLTGVDRKKKKKKKQKDSWKFETRQTPT